MLSLILGFITGLAGPISQTIAKITDLKIAQVNADSDKERAAIDAAIQEAHDRKAVLIAEAGSRLAGGLNATMRFGIAFGPFAVLNKIFVWDKVVGSFSGCAGPTAKKIGCETFTTDPLSPELWAVITAVIAFYFAYDMVARYRK